MDPWMDPSSIALCRAAQRFGDRAKARSPALKMDPWMDPSSIALCRAAQRFGDRAKARSPALKMKIYLFLIRK